MAGLYWLETLGCPKNRVDSDKLAGTLMSDGYRPASCAEEADLVVVNTCAFIEAAREESVEVILELAGARREGARLVVTGCLAERYGSRLADSLPEVDLVAGFGVPVTMRRTVPEAPLLDLLNLPRPAASAPWAYVKVAEGCDRRCGFCAIPQFRGRQVSRSYESILNEVDELGAEVREVVLVAQDLASWGLDSSTAPAGRRGGVRRPISALVSDLADLVERVRLLYLYPSALDQVLIEAIVATGVPYFDLSLQHVSRPLLRNMRRWGGSDKFLDLIARIRSVDRRSSLRSSFILGYPGETEEDQDRLLEFLEAAQLDWAGFFTFSEEEGTLAAGLTDKVAPELALERLRECSELQDSITASRRSALVSQPMTVLVDEPGVGRSYREAPEIDGVVHVPVDLRVGDLEEVVATGAAGPDLWARRVRVGSSGESVVTESAMAESSRATSAVPHSDPPGPESPLRKSEPLLDRLRPSRFGPSALATPANAITLARLLATPALVVLVALNGAGWAPFAVAFVIGATDGVDGWIARRQGATRSGAFLDPLADKVVVLSALFVLAAKSEVEWLPVALIAGRELAITVYRAVVGRRGVSIPARTSAKVKTLVQGIAILLALAPGISPHKGVVSVAMWVALAFTLVTGAQYLVDGRRALRSGDPHPDATVSTVTGKVAQSHGART